VAGVKRCVILLDGAEKNDAIRKELAPADIVVAVDRAVETCFALDRPPKVAFLGDGTCSEKAADWASFSGVEREDYRPRDGSSGFELALEWALTTDGIGSVDVVNALGRSPADDAARLFAFARHHASPVPLALLTAAQRAFVLSGGYTLNGKAGHEFSLIPLTEGSSATVKNGKQDFVAKGALVRQKLEAATANLTVSSGHFLLFVPR
jgi:thiamine pyrophosphokinase